LVPTWSEEQGAFLGHVAEAKFDLLTDHTTDADLVWHRASCLWRLWLLATY
jgi:hypothetical protein